MVSSVIWVFLASIVSSLWVDTTSHSIWSCLRFLPQWTCVGPEVSRKGNCVHNYFLTGGLWCYQVLETRVTFVCICFWVIFIVAYSWSVLQDHSWECSGRLWRWWEVRLELASSYLPRLGPSNSFFDNSAEYYEDKTTCLIPSSRIMWSKQGCKYQKGNNEM